MPLRVPRSATAAGLLSVSFMIYRKLAYSVASSPACGMKGSVGLLFVSFHFFTLDKLKIFVAVTLSPEAISGLPCSSNH